MEAVSPSFRGVQKFYDRLRELNPHLPESIHVGADMVLTPIEEWGKGILNIEVTINLPEELQ